MIVFRIENKSGLGPIHGYRIIGWEEYVYDGEAYKDEVTERLMPSQAFLEHPTGSMSSRYISEYGNYYRRQTQMKFAWSSYEKVTGFINPKWHKRWRKSLRRAGFFINIYDVSSRNCIRFRDGQVMIPRWAKAISRIEI